MVLMPRVVPKRLAARARVVAAVLPRFTASGPTRLTKASKVDTLITLASTAPGLPFSPALHVWFKLGDFVEHLPCYRLEIGEDVGEIPSLVGQLLAEATG